MQNVEQDPVRTGMHQMWASVADAWEANADYVDGRSTDLTDAMLAAVALAPGDRVLELACGPGTMSLAASPIVGPSGEVVASDVAEEMAAIARRRAGERGLANVTARRIDMEEIDEPDSSFDAVVVREGLMFAVDQSRAAREIARVLKPGGRVAAATWGPRERNPWLGVVLDAVGEQVGAPVPPPGMPGPFALSDPAELEEILAGAGFRDVAIEEIAVPYDAPSFDEWWGRTVQLAGPISKLLDALPSEAKDELRERLLEAVKPYESDGGLAFEGVSLLATAVL